jgi:hypothetical protein
VPVGGARLHIATADYLGRVTTWDSKPKLRAVPGPLVLVVRDAGDLAVRCETALEALPYIRVQSCVSGELREVAAALQPSLVVAAPGHAPIAAEGIAVVQVGDERGDDLRRLLIDAIRRALIR